MELSLFKDGSRVHIFPIEKTARDAERALVEGSYVVTDLSEAEVSTLAMVRFPYYVRVGDSYAIHGVPTHASGEPFSGLRADGSVMLSDEHAKMVYDFVAIDTPLYVRTNVATPPYGAYTKLVVQGKDVPATSARAFAVADLARGQILLEKNSGAKRPIASITKLFTAVVASDVVGHGTEIEMANGEKYTLGDLFYPLLLRSDNTVAEYIARRAGTKTFIASMNTYVQSLGMPVTSFADASGLSPYNLSSAYDLTTFARHLFENKRYVLDLSKSGKMTITSASGEKWKMVNQNKLASDPYFVGGKLGFTDEAAQTALSIFTLPIDGQVHTVAVVVLGSSDWKQDTRTLLRWLLENVEHGA
jgi:D-alanyl-D-alanine carboxypeptidase